MKHVIWDWNGTIVNDFDISVSVVNGMLHKRKLPTYSREEIADTGFKNVKDFYTKIGIKIECRADEVAILTEYNSGFMKRALYCFLQPLVLTQLNLFMKAGCKQYIVSVSPQSAIDYVLDNNRMFSIRYFFTDVVGRRRVDQFIPKEELLLALMEKHGIKTPDAILIGDTVADYKAAVKVGIEDIRIYPVGYESYEKIIDRVPEKNIYIIKE